MGCLDQRTRPPMAALSMGRNIQDFLFGDTSNTWSRHRKEWHKISCLITPNTVQVRGGEPPSLQQPREPRDAVGRLRDCGRDEPGQAGQAGEALPEDCAALSRGAKLQLHVRHHVGARTQRCLQVGSELNSFFAEPKGSVRDPNPDPPDPHVFGPLGCTCFWASRICIRIH